MEIIKSYETLDLTRFGYSDEADIELHQRMWQLGYQPSLRSFRLMQGALGTLETVLPYTIAKLSLNTSSVAGIVALNLLSNVIYDTLKEIKAVMIKDRTEPLRRRPIVKITATASEKHKSDKLIVSSISTTFFVDVDLTKDEILNTLESTAVNDQEVSVSKTAPKKPKE